MRTFSLQTKRQIGERCRSVWELNEHLVFIARRKPIGLSRFMRENSNPLQFEGPASVEKNVKRVPARS
nr:hypothetical protein [Tanacetum cinerariifolium]